MTHMRHYLDLAYPNGAPFEPDPNGDMEKWRDATANNLDYIREDVKKVAFIRDPVNTPVLSDLEKEYGIITNNNLTEQERIDLLNASFYAKQTNATDDDLQAKLDRAGFDLTVYNNSPNGPAIDPAIILDQNFVLQAQDGTNYYAGNTLAYAGRLGGDLLVNGDIFDQRPDYLGAGDVFAGNLTAVAGYFTRLVQEEIVYTIPTDPDSWPFVFFVGGAATFDAITGEILTIEQGLVPSAQEKQLNDIILKHKPMFTWCGRVITFT